MKKIILFILITLNQSVLAQIPANLNKLEPVIEDLTFIDTSNPGYMTLNMNGNEIEAWFFYDFIKYEDISTWDADEIINIVFNEKMGYGIVRQSTDMFYKVIFIDKFDQIKIGQSICMKQVGTIRDEVNCYKTSVDRRSVEYKYLYRNLIQKLPDDVANEVKSVAKAFEEFNNRFSNAYGNKMRREGGTIQALSASMTSAELWEMRFNWLLKFYF